MGGAAQLRKLCDIKKPNIHKYIKCFRMSKRLKVTTRHEQLAGLQEKAVEQNIRLKMSLKLGSY